MGTVNDALRVAASQIGYTETPVNVNRFSSALGRPAESWCADFAEWVLRQVGIAPPVNTYGNASTLVRSFPAPGAPAPGDLVGYHFAGEPAGINHVGIVESVAGGFVTSIEGNTSSGVAGSQSNGGGVYRRVRPLSQVVAFGRPPYTSGVKPMFSPPLPIVAYLDCPSGGSWLLGQDGAVYAVGGAAYLGGANGKAYFAGRTAAQLALVDGKYQIIDTAGEKYGPGF